MSTIPTTNTVIPNLPLPPVTDYTSRDYNAVLSDLINAIPTFLPEWTDRSPGDFGMVLLELFSFFADTLNYYVDRVANEAFLATAQQRSSILAVAQLLDYRPTDPVAATTTLQFTITSPSPQPVVIPAGTPVTTQQLQGSVVSFETDIPLTIWGDNTTPSVATQISSGQPNQVVLIPGAWDGFTQTVTVGGAVWNFVPTLTGQLSTATVYTTSSGDEVVFGNGSTGAIPPLGAAISVTYFPIGGSQYTGQVSATQGVSILAETLGASSGTANQVFTLFKNPVINGSVVMSIDEGSGANLWTFFNRLVDAGPTDRAFTTNTDATGVVTVTFGDGVNGLIPAPGATISANYRVGGGQAGNVSANTLIVMPLTVTGVIAVTNTTPAAGGADAETTDHIRTHAPLSLSAINRAVTLQDYAALALVNPGVSKASASATVSTAVTVYVHPSGDFISDTTPTGLLYQRVQAIGLQLTNAQNTGFLDTRMMAGTTVNILGPQYNNLGTLQLGYVPIDVSVSVFVLPNYHSGAVQSAVIAAISSLFSFSNVDFGSRISLLSVYAAMNSVPGVGYGQVLVLSRHEIQPPIASDIQCANYEIPQANIIITAVSGGIPY